MKRNPSLTLAVSLVLATLAVPAIRAAEAPPVPAGETAPQDAEALFQLGRAHLAGTGKAKDPKKALDLMRQAAATGHAEALGGVGYFYANGIAVEKDEAKAVEWFRKGAEKGGPRSQYNLGRMLLDGKGVAKDEAAGRACMKKAADQGVTEALFALGNMYYFGEFGESKDYKQALPLLKQAAEQGHPDSQNMVGVMLCDGLGVQRDAAEGMSWYRKAAMQGHAKAQANLGRMLGPSNRRPEKDPAERIEALAWLIVAEGQGEVTSKRVLAEAYPTADEKEVAAARKKAAEIRNNLNSEAALRKLVPAAASAK